MLPTTSRPPLCTRAGGLSLLLGAACFLAGLSLSGLLHPYTLLPSRFSPAASASRISTAAEHGHSAVPVPLGLDWYRKGHANPWQFSVLRTGIDDLHEALQRVEERDGKLPRLVVSLTSLPRRFTKYVRATVQKLKSQNYMPDHIYVVIPLVSRRSDENFTVPAWLQDDPLVTVLRPPVDMGPATKLIPVLQEEGRLGNMDARVVTLDDDDEGSWTPESLMGLFAYSLAFEDAAIGYTGWNVTCMVKGARCDEVDSGVPMRQSVGKQYNFVKAANDYACHSLADWLPDYFANCVGAVRRNFVAFVDVLEGYRGVLYQPRFFDVQQLTSLMDSEKTPEYFFLCDDVWFSGWLGVRGVRRIVVNPALHGNAPVREALEERSKKRGLSAEMLPEDKEAVKRGEKGSEVEVEAGLHSLAVNFVQANHDGVQWFQERGAWTQGMWDKPHGFKYPSEIKEEE